MQGVCLLVLDVRAFCRELINEEAAHKFGNYLQNAVAADQISTDRFYELLSLISPSLLLCQYFNRLPFTLISTVPGVSIPCLNH